MGYQLPDPATLAAVAVIVGRSCWRIKIALGLGWFESGVVGGALKTWPKPNASHSLVTPTHGVGGGALQYSTRIQGPVMAAGVAGLVVSSPINGIEAQVFFNPLSV